MILLGCVHLFLLSYHFRGPIPLRIRLLPLRSQSTRSSLFAIVKSTFKLLCVLMPANGSRLSHRQPMLGRCITRQYLDLGPFPIAPGHGVNHLLCCSRHYLAEEFPVFLFLFRHLTSLYISSITDETSTENCVDTRLVLRLYLIHTLSFRLHNFHI